MEPIKLITLRDVAMAATQENHIRLVNDFHAWIQMAVAVKSINPTAICHEMHWKDDGDHRITGLQFIPIETAKRSRKPRKKK